jgi:hypothetical protein
VQLTLFSLQPQRGCGVIILEGPQFIDFSNHKPTPSAPSASGLLKLFAYSCYPAILLPTPYFIVMRRLFASGLVMSTGLFLLAVIIWYFTKPQRDLAPDLAIRESAEREARSESEVPDGAIQTNAGVVLGDRDTAVADSATPQGEATNQISDTALPGEVRAPLLSDIARASSKEHRVILAFDTRTLDEAVATYYGLMAAGDVQRLENLFWDKQRFTWILYRANKGDQFIQNDITNAMKNVVGFQITGRHDVEPGCLVYTALVNEQNTIIARECLVFEKVQDEWRLTGLRPTLGYPFYQGRLMQFKYYDRQNFTAPPVWK